MEHCEKSEHLHHAEAGVHEGPDKYRDLFDFAPIGYYLLDEQGCILEANLAGAALLGLDRSAAIKTRLAQCIATDDRAVFAEFCTRVVQTGVKQRCEVRLCTGVEVVHALIEGVADQGCLGKQGPCRVAVIDVTDRKQAEEAAWESEERFSSLFQKAPLGYQSLDAEGRFLLVNEAWLETLGYRREEVIGHWFGDFLAPEFVEAFRARFPVFKAAGRIHSEFEMLHKDGQRRFIAFEGRISHKSDGSFGRTHCILQDITDRKRAELALQDSEQRFRRAILEAPFPLMIHAEDGRVVAISRTWTELTGYAMEDIPTTAVWAEKAYGAAKEMVREEIEALYGLPDRKAEGEYAVTCCDGSRRVWDFSSVSLGRMPDGCRIALSMASDVTERNRADAVLRRFTDDLTRSNKELEQFAYVTSHDLKEPLRMVTAFTSLLQDHCRGKLDAQADAYIQFASDAAARMRVLIDDLLAYSRTGRGLATESVDVGAVLDDVLRTVSISVEESGAVITRDALPAITANPMELNQVFLNLLGNALKFRSQRRPEIHVSAAQEGGYWRFTVRDNGIGIDPQFADRIFMIFERLHTREQYPGTGIGLAVCRKIVEDRGGRIWVESAPGDGSAFHFTIPLGGGNFES